MFLTTQHWSPIYDQSPICGAVESRSTQVLGFANRDRCYDFKNIFAKKFGKKMAFLAQNKGKLCKMLIITLVFEKNAIFPPKIVKNCRKLRS
jgi:hypothetical protein